MQGIIFTFKQFSVHKVTLWHITVHTEKLLHYSICVVIMQKKCIANSDTYLLKSNYIEHCIQYVRTCTYAAYSIIVLRYTASNRANYNYLLLEQIISAAGLTLCLSNLNLWLDTWTQYNSDQALPDIQQC